MILYRVIEKVNGLGNRTFYPQFKRHWFWGWQHVMDDGRMGAERSEYGTMSQAVRRCLQHWWCVKGSRIQSVKVHDVTDKVLELEQQLLEVARKKLAK